MPKNQDELIAELLTEVKWIKEYLMALDNKKANKWTEAVLKFMLSGIGIAIITALMGLIIAPKAFSFGMHLYKLIKVV